MRKLTDLRPQARNANKHTPRGLGALERSIQADGWIGAITVAADGETFDGSARIEVGASAGFDDAIVIHSDGTRPIVHVREDIPTADDPRAKRLGVAANRIAQLDYDPDAQLLAELAGEVDLSPYYTTDELAALLAQVEVEPGGGGDDFDTTPADGPTRTQLGDLWQIGPHRLLVGDCTIAENVARLMDGKRANAVFTDPPYGVDYEGETNTMFYGDGRRGVSRERIAGDVSIKDAATLLTDALPLFPSDVLFVWHAPMYHTEVRAAITALKWEPFVVLVWNKNVASFAAMGARYKPKFELAIGCKHDRIPWYGPDNEVTVWDVNRASVNEWHPTQKPIELFERLMRNHTKAGDLCAEPFAGGGAQYIAAHRTGRRCYGMEISPRYADVILRRAEAEGLTCERIDG